MLYPKNDQPFDHHLFSVPTSEYRGTPFWAWNDALDAEELCRQIDHFRKMGLGGFHMHVRTGMATPYLSEAFMQLIEVCVNKARELNMLAWLYDEDRWPSGAAGGLVTKNPQYRARHLLFTRLPYQTGSQVGGQADASARAGRTGNGRLLACYDIELDSNGCLCQSRQIDPDQAASGQKWYAYLETALPSPWYNNQTYVDTLNPAAIAAFIDTTHRRYAERVGQDFGRTIPAIFTDEPQFTHKTTLNHAREGGDLVMPWTDDFSDTLAADWQIDIMERLPELFWELPDGRYSLARYAYHDHVAERFAAAFADQCGRWCRDHGLMLTGHLMEEPSLRSQTAALGEAMRSYRSFDLPGIDMLCNNYELTTAKQAQSAVHQYGYPGVLSELYGVTNWDFDFRGHKLQGDWQAALGVTVRVHHLSWYSMKGEAKRDYPASIHYQSSWSERYPLIEDYFARVNTAMTRGRPVCRVGVIHPVESFWLCWGPQDQTAARRDQLDRQFSQLTEWLLFGQIDFDFISESLLPQQCPQAENPLQVGEMAYDLVIIPDVLTLRSSTLSRLAAFRQAGGQLICLGQAPKYVDGRESREARLVYEQARQLDFSLVTLLEALEPVRELDLFHADGKRADHLLYQLREDADKSRWLFIAAGRDPGTVDQPRAFPLNLVLRGLWQVSLFDTLNGCSQPLAVKHQENQTLLSRRLFEHDSLLLELKPADPVAAQTNSLKTAPQTGGEPEPELLLAADDCRGPIPITTSEPNVLLLDQAEYRLDDQPWQPREEILRADNALREQLGWPSRQSHIAQPWTVSEQEESYRASLRFTITCECQVKAPLLALEEAEKAAIRLDQQTVTAEPVGWYVDRQIKTISLPDLTPGSHQLEISWPFGLRSNLEWCYLLGCFSVTIQGDRAVIRPPVREVTFSDLTSQGFPFYGGALTYHLKVVSEGGRLQVHIPFYRATMIDVRLDGQIAPSPVFSPYTTTFTGLEDGEHDLELILYASRVNSFGSVHNCDRSWHWHGPDSWRTRGDQWAYEYQLRELGILKAPVIRRLPGRAGEE